MKMEDLHLVEKEQQKFVHEFPHSSIIYISQEVAKPSVHQHMSG